MFSQIFANVTLWISIVSWAMAQIIKIIIYGAHNKKINWRLLFGSGGMPSSHSAFVCSMTTAIGINEGFNSSLFAVSAIMSLIVMYDAAGVRRAAGKQAAVINIIVENIEAQGIKFDGRLKELLGHSPIEVFAGALLGIFVSVYILLF